ncbi:hypothetical protein [Halodesulfovibrio marinisediminis]|uniref:Uncharacterized protein n=1 Tax=Halodesulfovibrio marinisediminis DSM 17456 TaxID=1121457 RepID=A0A1N6IXK1_9BACT|nr:hypothetical protein [Halodesulfovibrio marinisediminis]SIO36762.1 hypothetical protein SAMN02745161_3032 [Halodesulfovibrio marinisediminis DSM 17456]
MGGGKGKISVSAPPPAPVPPAAPPVQEQNTVSKTEMYSSITSRQAGKDSRRATILTGSQGDESEAQLKKSTLLGS